jgi:hypothetical protein
VFDYNLPVRELDLHGLSVDAALKTLVELYNYIQSNPQEPIRIVHGYGSSGEGGKIRVKLREFLASASSSLDWKPGEDVEGNLGVTIVYPRKTLLARGEQLASAILGYCSVPRSESKIAGEFRAYDAREVKQALRGLLRQGTLKGIIKSGHTVYIRAQSYRLRQHGNDFL